MRKTPPLMGHLFCFTPSLSPRCHSLSPSLYPSPLTPHVFLLPADGQDRLHVFRPLIDHLISAEAGLLDEPGHRHGKTGRDRFPCRHSYCLKPTPPSRRSCPPHQLRCHFQHPGKVDRSHSHRQECHHHGEKPRHMYLFGCQVVRAIRWESKSCAVTADKHFLVFF